jgi:hypothetical protein
MVWAKMQVLFQDQICSSSVEPYLQSFLWYWSKGGHANADPQIRFASHLFNRVLYRLKVEKHKKKCAFYQFLSSKPGKEFY